MSDRLNAPSFENPGESATSGVLRAPSFGSTKQEEQRQSGNLRAPSFDRSSQPSQEPLEFISMPFEQVVQELTHLVELADEYSSSLPNFLGGYSSLHSLPENEVNHFKGNPMSSLPLYVSKKKLSGFAKKLDVGFDYDSNDTNPMKFKYYVSLSSIGAGERGLAFFNALAEKCIERGVSMQYKPFDRNYDNCFYTYHPREFTLILQEIYSEFEDIFDSVPRVFHGKVAESIPTEHIGCVQEPNQAARESTRKALSHSDRMHQLGTLLERIDFPKQRISQDQWFEICASIGIRADAPWLLT